MEIRVDIFYKNTKRTSKINTHISHEVITEDDIIELAKNKSGESRPMWMGEEWEIDSANIDEIKI